MTLEVIDSVWKELEQNIDEALVPCILLGETKPYDESDFVDHKKSIDQKLEKIISITKQISYHKKNLSDKVKKKLLKLLLLIGENSQESPWNSKSTVEKSFELQKNVCEIFRVEKLFDIFKEDQLFQAVIKLLRPKLLKNTWKLYSSAIASFKWIVTSTEKPLLKFHICQILPTILIILDDFEVKNQLIGLECLHKILQHCEKSRNLQSSTFDIVLYDKLKHMIYVSKSETTLLLYTCFVQLLDIIEYSETSTEQFTWGKRDDIIALFLSQMQLNAHENIRNTYVQALMIFLESKSIAKWSNTFAEVLSSYCENKNDMNTLKASYEALLIFLSKYRPKAQKFYTTIYVPILKTRFDILSSEISDKDVIAAVNKCIKLLKELSPNTYNILSENPVTFELVRINS